jgi:chitinase
LVTRNSVTLQWDASKDNIGVKGYRVYGNGQKLADVSGTSYRVNNLKSRTKYTFTVEAYDAAGNTSAKSQISTTTRGGWTWRRWWW